MKEEYRTPKGKKRFAEWQRIGEEYTKRLSEDGAHPFSICRLLAEKYGRSPYGVRWILIELGLFVPKKRNEKN